MFVNNIMTIKNVRGYLDKDGTAHLNAEDVARGFGFTTVANSGNVVVRWARVNEYLSSFGYSQQVAKDSFIPENMVYRLGFKASNETAQKFQALLADEILPIIRKTGTYSINSYQKKSTSVGEVTNLIKVLKGTMKDQNHNAEDIAAMTQIICNQFNVILPQNFVKKPHYEQLTL